MRTVQIVNNLSSAVEVMYNEERRQVLQSGGNTAHFIPIQYLDNGSLTFCPMLRNGRLQRSASLSIASLLRAPATQSSQSGRWSQQKTTVARGALELRKVITFYWDVHPEHASDDSAFEDDFSVSRPPFQVILTVVRKSEKHETVFTISPPIRIENLVPYALAFRSVCVKSERDIQWVADNAASFSGTTGSVPSGSSSQVCELEIFSKSLAGKTDTVQAPAAVALSIAIPGIGCTAFSKWTEDSFIYGSRRQCRQIQIVPAEAVDHDIRAGKESVCPLQLQVEIVTTEVLGNEQLNILTPVICRIYVEYWLIDRTCLSLKMRTNDGRRIIPCPTESVESESNAPVALFSGDQKQLISTMKISVPDTSGGDIDSKAFDITTVGLRGQLTLRAADAISRGSRRRSLEEDASLRKQYDIGVMIEQGPSLFSRTTIVTFVPRYYFINNSNRFEIQVKQDGDEDANALVLAPKEGCFFHWNDYRLSNRVQLRFVCHEDCDTVVEDGSLFRDESFVHGVSEWSLPLEVSSVGNFVVRLQKALLQAPSFFCGACYQSDDTHGHTDAADAMKDQCEVLAGMPLHVGVELHDPALVVRFHEGNNTVSRDVRNTDIKDFIPFKLKNECTAFEMVVWQKIPADPEGRAFTFEGGERVLPFHTLDFVPYAASVAPTLYVQVQALFDPTTKGDREVDDTWLVMSHAAPRVVTTFEVSLNKLHRMPVLHVMDGKHKKRLWVEVMLDDATKTLHVTDVLPGSSSEHKRRRRAALIRSWKRYNAYIRWDSRHLSKSRLSKTIPEVDEDALREEETESKKKQVRFADEKTDEDLADTQSEEETVKEPSKDGNSRMETGNPFTLGVRVVECSHLEDLYPVQTNVASCSPFLRVDISGTAGEATCKVRSQSLAVAPRWLPLVGEKQSVDVLMCTGFIGADGKTSLDAVSYTHLDVYKRQVLMCTGFIGADGKTSLNESDCRQVEIEVREGNKIFGSSLLGRASLPLSSYLDAMRQSNESHHVFDILVPVLPVDKSSRSIQAVPSLRTMVRLQIACDISKQGEIGVPNGLRIQEAIKNYRVEHQLDRLVRCKSQLRVLLERESVDISVGEELNDSMATLGLANTGLPHGSRQFIPPILNRYHDSGTESVSSRRFDRITSEMTEDSASDLGFEQLGTERLLSVVLTGVAKLQIPSLQNQVNGADGVEPKVYCTVSYKNSTRSAISSVAKPSQVRVALKWDYRSTGAKQKCDEELRAYLQLEVQGVFLSFVDDGLVPYANTQRPPREVLSVSLSARHADVGVQLCYGLISDGRHVINTRVGHLQVDNQLLDTNYPVMVYPLRLTDTAQQEQNDGDVEDEGTIRSGDSALLPTFQLMSVFSKRRSLFEVEYIFVQLQELDVKLEDAVLVATAQAFSGITWAKLGRQGIEGDRKRATAVGTAMSLVDARWPFPTTPVFPVSMLNVEHRGGNMKVLLRWMLLCPIKVNVTFTSTTDRSNLLSLVSPEMSTALRSLISAAAALVSNLDQALIKIPEFYVENLLETTHTLAFYAMQHYLNHGLRSWYRIVGSVDVLGNPIGLVSALGAGVKDFFYTPAQMLLEDEKGLRIENLRTGMTKGSKSLLRNTAVGIFHTTGKITETLGKGVALLAMDDQYNVQRQRETIKQKKRINDLGDAIAEGGKGLVGGVWDGLKGVVEAPVRGAERDGAGGFVVGIGQGFAGLIVKPTAGFLDMLTSLSRGAKSSAEAIDGDGRGYAAVTRVRLPRRICSDGVLVSYSEREARGCAILALTSLDATDDYVFHLDYGIDAQRGILLLTDKRVICLSSKSGQKLWEVALDSSLVVDGSAAFLSIGQSKASNKVYKIECDDTTAASNFKLAVASARMDLSATRYLLLNLEQKQDQARNNALRGIESEDEQRVDLNLLMGNLQDTMVTGLTDEDLQTQPLRSVQVEVCHLENKDAVANVPKRAMISFQLFLSFSVFQIIVYGGPYQWTIYRRFSEFRDLYAALEKIRVSLPPLSPGVSSNVPRARARTNDGDRISEDDRAETSSAIEIREQIPMSL
ncbi:TPA: LOW QUALITY PROTEIN: hypothetical protein N0F65_012003 [Lagenidium giganteum]|uniref:Vacuolar protein sorting-associated protein 13 n=1 Tax=Lagenidium giganteum TaxID=4803 RepID=A0AAV2Z8I4_9STRA|nr:TPA: LOW QUALITY PROTEIN: hypothetical protein N0F65_012003 [Lagenidium giganteum]